MSNFLKNFIRLLQSFFLSKTKNRGKNIELTQAQKNLIKKVGLDHSNSLIRILVGDLPSLIPSEIALRRLLDPFRDLFEGLTVFDSYGNLVGGMAERWEKEDSGKVWKFFIRKNARWSDGSLIFAEDFVYGWRSVFEGHINAANDKKNWRALSTFTKVLSKNFPLKNGFEVLNGKVSIDALGVRAMDKRILEVRLEHPVNDILFLSELSDRKWYPLREEYVTMLRGRQKNLSPESAKQCVSNGAFSLEFWEMGKEISLVKNPYYYSANKVFWPSIKYIIENDPQTRIHLWDSGYVDLYPIGEHEKATLEFDAHYLKRMKHVPANAINMFICNLRQDKLKKVEVRHAFNMLFNRYELLRFWPSAQWVIYGCLSLDDLPLKAAKPYWISFSMSDRIVEARRLLQAENFSEENPLRLTVNHFVQHDGFEHTFLESFSKVPEIKVTLSKLSGDECFENLISKNFEICMYAEGSVSKHCLQRFLFYLSQKTTEQFQSFSGYNNAKFDALVDSLYSNDCLESKHEEIYEELDKILVEDVAAFPWVLDSVSVLISDRILSSSFFKWNYSSGAIYSKNLALSEN